MRISSDIYSDDKIIIGVLAALIVGLLMLGINLAH